MRWTDGLAPASSLPEALLSNAGMLRWTDRLALASRVSRKLHNTENAGSVLGLVD